MSSDRSIRKARVAMMAIKLPSDFEESTRKKLKTTSSGKFFKHNNPKLVPSFDRDIVGEDGKVVLDNDGKVVGDELTLDKILGTGAFCEVREIKAITLKRETSDCPYEKEIELIPKPPSNIEEDRKPTEEDNDDVETDEADFPIDGIFTNKSQIRNYMHKYCLRPGEEDMELHARYALKQLKPTDSEKHIRQGLIDISIEAQFLACLNHPNIIKMRGLVGRPFSPDFGIILDRLYMTLDDKMLFWREERKASLSKHLCGCLGIGFDKATKQGLLFQAITVAYDLSSAMRYISNQNLVYRDTKPQNAGFDVRGDVKLFDFGFVKELTKSLYDKESGQYKLTPYTGSIPYMAPEVLLGQPYGKPSDVFSFGVLLWEMLHYKYAFYHFDRRDYLDVIARRGYRPSIDGSLPLMVRTIIKESWDQDPAKRPSFDRIAVLLKAEYQSMVSGDMLDHSAKLIDKSTRSFRARVRNTKEQFNEALGEEEG